MKTNRINDGLTGSQRETCTDLFRYCVFKKGTDRRVTEATKVAFGKWLMARDKAGQLTKDQLIKYTIDE